MRLFSSKALALIPVLALAGCDLFSAETKVDDACVSLQNQTIDGVPAVAGVQTLTRSFSYDQGLTVFDGFIALDAQVESIKIDLEAVAGVEDLSFLESVHVSVSADDLPDLMIFACDDGTCASDSMETVHEVTAPPNLTEYALGGHVVITITVVGELPPTAWQADFTVCMSGSAKVAGGF